MSDVIQYPTTDQRIEAMRGSQRCGYNVIVEGRQIPGLTMYEVGDKICLEVDNRLGVDFPRDLAPQAAWLVANALAIGAGYPHLGAPSKEMPFAPRVVMLGSLPEDEA